MADIYFTCPRCKQHLVIDEAGVGRPVGCPTCTHLLTVPGLNLKEDLKRTQKVLPFEYPKPSSFNKPPGQAPGAHPRAA